MKRVILFRFHQQFRVCENHIEILRRWNPGVPIYGMYGGPEKHAARAKALPLDNCFVIPMDDPVWKWLNGDLCTRWWFRAVGNRFDFDMLHIVEWDLVLLASIGKLLGHVTDGVAITSRQPLEKIVDRWTWTAPTRGREEWKLLLQHMRKTYDFRGRKHWAGIFPGASMSRAFLMRYASDSIPGLCNDEVRMPLFAQAFRMRVHDTGLKNRFVNAMEKVILPNVLYKQKENGVAAFHPVRECLDLRRVTPRV